MMNWIKGLFRRKPEPRDERQMTEDWMPGDVAVCVEDRWEGVDVGVAPPTKGRAYKVICVRDRVTVTGRARIISLVLDGVVGGWDNRGFRKLRPDTKEADQEFVADLRDRLKVST